MIHKWVLLNFFLTLLVIVLVGFSIKEFACYQFNQYAESEAQAKQFRQTIEAYLLYAGVVALVLTVVIHLFFAKKILQPLKSLFLSAKRGAENKGSIVVDSTSQDEISEISNEVNRMLKRLHHLQQQQDQMVGDLAHELRTPLTTLKGYLEGLEEGVFTEDDSMYRLLKQECGHMISVVEKLNELQKWESEQTELNPEKIEIKEWMLNEIKKIEVIGEAGIEMMTDVDQAVVEVDVQALRTIMNQLLDNAAKFDIGGFIQLKGKADDNQYIISISHDGQPIPEDEADRLFEPMYRLDQSRHRSTGGPGLGLAIVKQVVQKMNGQAGLQTHNNHHTFWITIPQ
ncbi:sensor histidine kinase [Pseudalkalibacillus sp. R45]|uniref:sensor histidine kinase n=1 Tax=Pseudalkalibacillus sp. R45 TaxID=3457433 RepID=UPI003FCCE44A